MEKHRVKTLILPLDYLNLGISDHLCLTFSLCVQAKSLVKTQLSVIF